MSHGPSGGFGFRYFGKIPFEKHAEALHPRPQAALPVRS